jgi:hypothetical protein
MTETSANIRRLARAEGILPRRRNARHASEALSAAERQSAESRRNFASVAMEAALVAAFKHAFNTRKKEEGLSQAKLARSCGRHASSVGTTLSGRDWRLSTLSDFAEALGLRLEFSFVDRKYPHRRFTPSGVEIAQADPAQSESGALTSG